MLKKILISLYFLNCTITQSEYAGKAPIPESQGHIGISKLVGKKNEQITQNIRSELEKNKFVLPERKIQTITVQFDNNVKPKISEPEKLETKPVLGKSASTISREIASIPENKFESKIEPILFPDQVEEIKTSFPKTARDKLLTSVVKIDAPKNFYDIKNKTKNKKNTMLSKNAQISLNQIKENLAYQEDKSMSQEVEEAKKISDHSFLNKLRQKYKNQDPIYQPLSTKSTSSEN